ncbi:hypothetical protein QTJ16_003450 [Diplocarpon rosae]|uniref:Uncharacterized protein n=1 Tax=Diplocarpon rosae TaxID=946125 RepID=A0AAD9WFW1_9HELO|nr:hypothetical protein QTJ16_003450 [Diplocarpon rosae]
MIAANFKINYQPSVILSTPTLLSSFGENLQLALRIQVAHFPLPRYEAYIQIKSQLHTSAKKLIENFGDEAQHLQQHQTMCKIWRTWFTCRDCNDQFVECSKKRADPKKPCVVKVVDLTEDGPCPSHGG